MKHEKLMEDEGIKINISLLTNMETKIKIKINIK